MKRSRCARSPHIVPEIGLPHTNSFGQMDQYMALSKKDLQINITLNEMYNTHSLLQQHIETLVGSKADRTTTFELTCTVGS